MFVSLHKFATAAKKKNDSHDVATPTTGNTRKGFRSSPTCRENATHAFAFTPANQFRKKTNSSSKHLPAMNSPTAVKILPSPEHNQRTMLEPIHSTPNSQSKDKWDLLECKQESNDFGHAIDAVVTPHCFLLNSTKQSNKNNCQTSWTLLI